MSNVMLTLEGFAGSEISKVTEDAVATAQRCGCWAKVNINGIEVLIAPEDNAAWLVRNYELARTRHHLRLLNRRAEPAKERKKPE